MILVQQLQDIGHTWKHNDEIKTWILSNAIDFIIWRYIFIQSKLPEVVTEPVTKVEDSMFQRMLYRIDMGNNFAYIKQASIFCNEIDKTYKYGDVDNDIMKDAQFW